jgi:hypothetical protein
MRFLKNLPQTILMVVLVPVLLFEEWGWDPLAKLVAQLARLPIWARMESVVRGLPPWAAVLVFFSPMLLLLPVKLLGLFLLAEGHAKSALLLLLGAKVTGTAILARLFQLVEPALMRIPWFARWYPRWKAWKDNVLSAARQSTPWRAGRRLKDSTSRWWRSMRGAP